ncbi:hypothetical protein P4562_21255 [Lysinibacillus xylanilyticus]|uniref:hypothetical protein n=1 Tax=Lysinibacillus xylanilyticus TaxID=582475 RepID=UPI002E1D106C|nr:hypothetical protein [Lysinibacillus xylanilyticus]
MFQLRFQFLVEHYHHNLVQIIAKMEEYLMNVEVKDKMLFKANQMKEKVKAFLKDEKSANQYSDMGLLTFAGAIIFVIVLFIFSGGMDKAGNDTMNYMVDGVNGQVDETGLNKWSDQTDGFVRK